MRVEKQTLVIGLINSGRTFPYRSVLCNCMCLQYVGFSSLCLLPSHRRRPIMLVKVEYKASSIAFWNVPS